MRVELAYGPGTVPVDVPDNAHVLRRPTGPVFPTRRRRS